MKTISATLFFVLLIAVLVSCRQNKDEEIKPVDFELSASNYLRPLLQIGDSSTNIIARFGLPLSRHETGGHEICMYFFFSDTNLMASAAGAGGFAGYFTNNQLSHWLPIFK